MTERHEMIGRKMMAGFAAAMMLFIGAASAQAGSPHITPNAGPIDQIRKFAEQARAAGGDPPNIASQTAPVTKFLAIGRVNESLNAGGCLNNPITATCDSSTCDSVTMSGQVNATGLGKATLDACFTIILASNSGACLNLGGLSSRRLRAVDLPRGQT
jgi:hypothetical protein